MNRQQLRALLVQVRDATDPMREHERECIRRRIGARPVQLEVRNALTGSPDASWLDGMDALIIGGSGDYSVHHPRSEPWVSGLRRLLERALSRDLPGFGICFGHQLLGHHLGAPVVTHPDYAEIGTVAVQLTDEGRRDPVFSLLEDDFDAHTGHSDHVTEVPVGVERLATNAAVATQAFKVRGAPFYSTQFHPEMTGAEATSRFLWYRRSFDEALTAEAAVSLSRFRVGADATTVLLAHFIDHLLDEDAAPTDTDANGTAVPSRAVAAQGKDSVV